MQDGERLDKFHKAANYAEDNGNPSWLRLGECEEGQEGKPIEGGEMLGLVPRHQRGRGPRRRKDAIGHNRRRNDE